MSTGTVVTEGHAGDRMFLKELIREKKLRIIIVVVYRAFYMFQTLLHVLYMQQSHLTCTSITPILHLRKLSFKEVNCLAQGHTASNWQTQELPQRV